MKEKAKNRRNKIRISCESCGKMFERHFCHVKRVNHSYCSKKCFYKKLPELLSGKDNPNYKGPNFITCEFCSKQFEVYHHLLKTRRFCSQSCVCEWMNKTKRFRRDDAWKQKLREARLKQRPLPTGNTSIERKLQSELDKRKLKYEPHFVIGKRFEIDIAFPKKKLAVEADGDYWHSLPKQILADGRKNDYLKSIDWNIMRFTESEINDDVKSCADKIIAQLGGDN